MIDRQVRFPGKGRELDGYLALPGGAGRRPAVVVIQEIWGLDEHIREVARRLAGEGYVALAPDLYTGELRQVMARDRIVAAMTFLRQAPPEIQRDPSRIEALIAERPAEEQPGLRALLRVMGPAQREAFALDLVAALAFLGSLPEVDSGRLVSLGFCLGGGPGAGRWPAPRLTESFRTFCGSSSRSGSFRSPSTLLRWDGLRTPPRRLGSRPAPPRHDRRRSRAVCTG